VIDVKTEQVETPELVATRIRRALRVVPPDKLVINPDCGLRHLLPDIARAKLAAMVAGAALVRAEIAGTEPPAAAEPAAVEPAAARPAAAPAKRPGASGATRSPVPSKG
jgi:5-methyltetrahydropteroyltriglutamate--homocysteine methyltransferase